MMKPGPLLKSRVFRLTLVFSILFSVTAILLVGLIYWAGSTAVSRQIDTTIDAEIKGLREQYNQRGTIGLIRVIDTRSRNASRTGALYLLVQADGSPLAGNLNRWPRAAPTTQGRVRFDLVWQVGGRQTRTVARARIFKLPGGLRLLVGQDLRERLKVSREFETALIWGGLALVILALLSGAVLSWLILRRVDSISATSGEIMAGDLSRRVPVTGSGDEFDRLAARLNSMLEQNERLFRGLQEVAENIAHDLRSPLGRLRTRLEGIHAGRFDGKERQAAIGDAIEEADRLLRTFNAILKIAQAESGAPRRHFGAVDLRALLMDLAELYEPLAEEAGLRLETDVPARPVPVSGDRDLLFQACVNLIDNALKYAGAGRRVDLSLDTTGDTEHKTARITVADNGPGMPAEALARARDRFFRVDSSRTTKGSGLGLSLVDAVARLHDGGFDLANATLDGADDRFGLRATLTLPLDTAAPATDKAGNTTPAVSAEAGNERAASWSPSSGSSPATPVAKPVNT